MVGKTKRLKRVFNKSGNIVLIPMDHGITLGPIKGLENMRATISDVADNGADAVLLHKGLIKRYANELSSKDLGIFMHISASTTLGSSLNRKILTASVEDAIYYGCDAVSVHVNFGTEYESEMLKDCAEISSICDRYGMPLLVMLYSKRENSDASDILHMSRIGVELGADILKLPYVRDKEMFRKIINTCELPIIIAGGKKQNPNDIIKMVSDAIEIGAKGISIGRNIFQSDSRKKLLNVLSKIVNNHFTKEDALSKYKKLLEGKDVLCIE